MAHESEQDRLRLLEQLLAERFGAAPVKERVPTPAQRRHAESSSTREGGAMLGAQSPTLGT